MIRNLSAVRLFLRNLVLTGFLLVPHWVTAAPSVIDSSIKECKWKTGELDPACIPLFIGHLVQFIFAGIGMLFMVNVMIAGYQLAMGSITGDKGAGKDRLTWSIIGAILAICIFLILNLVLNVLFG